MVMPLPPKFKVPQMQIYNRSKDPVEHLEMCKAHMTLHSFLREIVCRAFPLTLKGAARVWFESLLLGTMGSFNKLLVDSWHTSW